MPGLRLAGMGIREREFRDTVACSGRIRGLRKDSVPASTRSESDRCLALRPARRNERTARPL